MPVLPPTPNLEHLKNQAKDLLRAPSANQPQARLRVQAQLPHLVAPSLTATSRSQFRFSHALLVVAREYGFPSWPKLKARVTAIIHDADVRPLPVERAQADAVAKTEAQRSVAETAAQIVELARRQDVEGLARSLSRLPKREILAVRAIVVEGGNHRVLVDALIAGTRHPHPSVRFDCAHAMDHLADDRCVEPLRQLLNDPVPRVRRVALHSLGCDTCKLTPLRTTDDLTALVIDRALSDPSINVRRHATVELGARVGDARAAAALQFLFESESDAAILRYARQALKHFYETSVALTDPHSAVSHE